MSFYRTLQTQTAAERERLLSAPIIQDALADRISLEQYLAFLTQAYHHVKHTVPLLMACGSRLPDSREWLRVAIAEYIKEETGHQEWILGDIAAAGGDAQEVRSGKPHASTELMISYAYDTIMRGNPVAFFGMVQVLEGTSVTTATVAADHISRTLGLPRQAFSYLYSHGDLDQDHIRFFAELMDRIVGPEDQAAILHAARMFYELYGNIFRAIPGSRRADHAA
ncbi:MAG: iron-containing redox enzyme family protein [Gammaproteobacteria bacterium]|jgi:thiaminase|nr:iron-containing redox enzyme family protein [Gammaproteobacteria bacterium]